MIVYFYWNGLILNIRFYFQYLFLIGKFIFAAISYFLLVWYSSEGSRVPEYRNCIPDLARAGFGC